MLLLITGCINVSKDMIYTTIKDKDRRLNGYKQTVKWAIKETNFDKIIFCENSNYNFDKNCYEKLAKEYNKEFEYLTFKGDTSTTNKKGKGYGEGEIIKYVLNNSKLMKDEDYFYKLTGRLKIININDIINSSKKTFFVRSKLANAVDLRFYGIQKKIFLEVLYDSYINVDDPNYYYLEHVYYDELKKHKVKYRTFCRRPIFAGFSGSTGEKYSVEKEKNEWLTTILFITNIYNSEYYLKLRRLVKRMLKKLFNKV